MARSASLNTNARHILKVFAWCLKRCSIPKSVPSRVWTRLAQPATALSQAVSSRRAKSSQTKWLSNGSLLWNWHHFTAKHTWRATWPLRSSCLTSHKSLFLIRLSTKLCRLRRICMHFLTAIIQKCAFAAMALTAQVTATWLSVQVNSWTWSLRSIASSLVISATARLSQP